MSWGQDFGRFRRSRRGPRRLADQIESFAAGNGITPAQLAIAWVLHQGNDIVPIPGTKRVSYLDENLAAARVQLSRDELARISKTVRAPAGERYDPAEMRAVGL